MSRTSPRPAPWSAEHVVSRERACALIESQFPALAPARAKAMGVGWDNTAYRVNGRFVFRFPRREVAVPCLRAEIRIMPRVAERLPLRVSAATFVGQPGDGYPWPFAGYEEIEGRAVHETEPDAGRRAGYAAAIAGFLRALHGIGRTEAERIGAETDPIGRLDLERRVPRLREMLADLAAQDLVPAIAPFERMIDDTPEDDPGKSPRTLVHGDFDSRHLLVDDAGAPRGVIDWGDVHLGHPAVDLAIVHAFIPPGAHERFREAYGSIDDEIWRLARFRATFVACTLMRYGREIGDRAILEAGWTALDQIANEGREPIAGG